MGSPTLPSALDEVSLSARRDGTTVNGYFGTYIPASLTWMNLGVSQTRRPGESRFVTYDGKRPRPTYVEGGARCVGPMKGRPFRPVGWKARRARSHSHCRVTNLVICFGFFAAKNHVWRRGKCVRSRRLQPPKPVPDRTPTHPCRTDWIVPKFRPSHGILSLSFPTVPSSHFVLCGVSTANNCSNHVE